MKNSVRGLECLEWKARGSDSQWDVETVPSSERLWGHAMVHEKGQRSENMKVE